MTMLLQKRMAPERKLYQKFKKISPQLVGSDLKTLALPVLLIYWAIILLAPFSQ